MNLSPLIEDLIRDLNNESKAVSLKKILSQWEDEHWILLDKKEINSTVEQFCYRLNKYIIPPDNLPLSFQRKPFENLNNQIIKILLLQTIEYPEKVGLLTDAIRETLGFKRIKASQFIILESHIDLTIIDKYLTNSLLEIGFEFDNFAKIEPEKYKYHFTLEYCIDIKKKYRTKELFDLVTKCSKEAAKIIQAHPKADGYVETEVYSYKDDRRFIFKPVTKQGLKHFPFNNESFLIFDLPLSESDSQKINISLDTHRVADIHLKIPSYLNHKNYLELETEEMYLLKEKLKCCGFYEIISESGNYIYTAHFSKTLESKNVFKKLVEFANTWGGFIEISKEICTSMWRKKNIGEKQTITLAEAPPLLSLQKQN